MNFKLDRHTEIKNPPKWLLKLFKWICPESIEEGLLGDLLEQFADQTKQYGERRAKIQFVWNIIRLIHPYILFKNKWVVNFLNMGLLKNHLLVAMRSMMKYKFYSFVNVLGLAAAIALVFLVSVFVQNQWSFDQFHNKKEKIFRLSSRKVDPVSGVKIKEDAITSIPLAPALKAEVTQIKDYTRLASTNVILMKDQTPFRESLTFVDQQFLEIFDFPMLSGSRSSALRERNAIVLTQDMAQKYFGYDDPMGKYIEVIIKDSTQTMQVTGIVDSKADQSSITFDLLVPLMMYQVDVSESIFNTFGVGVLESFVLLEEPNSLNDLSQLMSEVVQKYTPPSHTKMEIGLHSLSSMYFETEITGNTAFINPQKIWILVAIATLVLIVATINFITLSTGHALVRLKEVGLRKTLGAFNGQLRRQFVAEAFFVSLIACFVGVGIAFVMLPLFNNVLDANLSFDLTWDSLQVLFIVCILIAVVAGSLQGIALIQTKAQQALRGKASGSLRAGWLSRILIIIQFSLSTLLIMGTLVINAQMEYVQNKELGYDKERLLGLSMGGSEDRDANHRFFNKYKNMLSQEPQIQGVSAAMNPLKEKNWTKFRFMQSNEEEENIFFNLVTPEYVKSMGIEIVEGKDFRNDEPRDSKSILVNEALVRHFGFEDPLNAQIPGKDFDTPHRIVGVMKDFHFSTLHEKIEPLIIAVNLQAIRSGISGVTAYVWPPDIYQILVKVGPGDLEPVIEKMEEAWGNMETNEPFQCEFANEILARRYQEEQRYEKITTAASVFAILIAWMGLLGVTRLTVQKRTKEIGIRRVLGSTELSMISLLTRPFINLVLVSLILAAPMAWFVASEWLQSFTYRIDLRALEFVIAGGVVLLLTLLSVGFQAYRASLTSPVETIRCE
ncbi:ABC transporter permease [Reichenbachiella faecimaris]|uniref:ABC transporter permease n=1 Tax=Reichenbachiella faecimaris TaxID=692418 RepID=UPI000A04C458|nr:ABC transporter permease [Reichenbachiella faecimaris]